MNQATFTLAERKELQRAMQSEKLFIDKNEQEQGNTTGHSLTGRSRSRRKGSLEAGPASLCPAGNSDLDPGAPFLGEPSIDRWLSVGVLQWGLA